MMEQMFFYGFVVGIGLTIILIMFYKLLKEIIEDYITDLIREEKEEKS